MVKLLAANINEKISTQQLLEFENCLDENKIKKIKKFKYKNDYLRSLYGELLVRYEIIKKLSIKNIDISFSNNEYGKPFLNSKYNFHFNISHSDNWVVCAFSNEAIGVDIEVIKEGNLDIAKRFFTKDEYKALHSKSSSDQNTYFYKLWTLKESYIKWLGKGLSIPLDSFSISENYNNTFYMKDTKTNIIFNQFEFDNNYIISTCSTDPKINKIEVVSIKDLIIK